MPAYRKASIREVTKAAYELDGRFAQGIVHRDPESGRWLVGNTSVEDWLSRNEHQDVTLIVLSMDDDRPMRTRVCRTCGREYTGVECPHCREVRTRLRGRSRE
jgi:hypothetical protein